MSYMLQLLIGFGLTIPSLTSAKPPVVSLDLHGRICVSVISSGTERVSDWIKWNYKIVNVCDESFSLEIETNKGWIEYASVAPNQNASWFCTDGYRGQRDCGGLKSYTIKK
ncbi:hypothetical protein PQR64_35700 [Paraburkholderia phytofirmans]|uniref:hypothetical protein n=1 Tax=Paraburkholderia phytofirmans TaxID=261302 RepID=UPI0038BC7BD5